MPSVEDWATRCARRIRSEMLVVVPAHEPTMVGLGPSESRIAAIIVLHAEPLLKLLAESRREHHRGYNDEMCDYPPCPRSDGEPFYDVKCTCGADEWNAKVDEALR